MLGRRDRVSKPRAIEKMNKYQHPKEPAANEKERIKPVGTWWIRTGMLSSGNRF